MRNKNDVAGGVNNVSCVIYRNGSTVGSASGTITVSSSGYYTLYPHAYVKQGSTTTTVTLPGQLVYLTYVAPQPSYSTYTRSRQHSTWGYGDNSSYITRVYTKDGYIYTKDDPDLADDPTYYAPLSSREYWWYSDNGGGTWTKYGLLKAYITR